MSEWALTRSYQVIPLDDYREHEDSSTCWCGPCEDCEDDINMHTVWVHRAMDARESYEEGRAMH